MTARVRSMCLTALFATLLTVGAWITIPIGMPPYTMQSFVLYCALWLLPFRQSFGAVGLYLLMGAVGLPVFSGFRSGITVFLSPTGGYLLGFLTMPLIMLFSKPKTFSRIVYCALGSLTCYVFGTLWYITAYGEWSTGGILAALLQCVLPFLLPDAAKLALAAVVSKRLEPHLRQF